MADLHPIKIPIQVSVRISLWDAIKLRIAGSIIDKTLDNRKIEKGSKVNIDKITLNKNGQAVKQ